MPIDLPVKRPTRIPFPPIPLVYILSSMPLLQIARDDPFRQKLTRLRMRSRLVLVGRGGGGGPGGGEVG
jgi:hypothetical protein